MSDHNDEQMHPDVARTQQKLLELVDRVSDILESNDTPEQTAQKLMSDYGHDAFELADACARSFPGKRNSTKQTYWETVRDVIEKDTTTTH